MCGICGVYAYDDDALPVGKKLLEAMRDTMIHRGPDDKGLYISPDGRLGLGHRRLSIIDLSPAGRNPMSNEDGTIWIVYNGEVYNFGDYRTELEAKGHRFTSRTDTEVIIHLYEECGPDVVHKLRGMFAFVIWDARKRQLFMARDRIGIKPLYYTLQGGRFLFASEIKAILEDPAVPRAVNEEAFYHYLSFLTTPAPMTLFEGIYKLPAGHRAVLDAEGHLAVEEYWDVFDNVQITPDCSEAEYAAVLLEKLRQSVELRMISDVPFGVFLSGGIDSTTNVALMAELMDDPVQTFSIGFHDLPSYNEFEYAQLAAQTFGADYHDTRIGVQDLIDFLPKLVYHQDEPIADPVCVPVYYVARLAKESGTTVIQVGEGADEQFAYPYWARVVGWYYGPWRAYRMIPAPLRRLGVNVLSRFRDGTRVEYLRRGAHDEELFWSGAEAFQEVNKKKLLSPRLRRKFQDLSSHEVVSHYRKRFLERSPLPDDYLAWMGYVDLRLRLPELLLMRVDKMAMAASLEARVPFLDHEFVEFTMGIPYEIKLNGTGAKHLLKQAVKDILPHEIVYRPKQGFGTPVAEWMLEKLGEVAREKLVAFTRQTDFLDPNYIAEMSRRHDGRVWFLLNLALWHELWVK